MADYVLKTESGYFNISPSLFRRYAHEYVECMRSFNKKSSSSAVLYFLICRAIELGLKAKHLESKSRIQVKKEYGHNLKKSYDDLLSVEKTLDITEYSELVKASEIYDIPNKGFEYVALADALTQLEAFPDIEMLERIAIKVLGHQ